MYNLFYILIIIVALWGAYALHSLIKNAIDPHASVGAFVIYFVLYALMIFLLVYLCGLLIIWGSYWLIKR